LQALNDVLASAVPIQSFLERYPDLVQANQDYFPPALSWAVAVPTGEVDNLQTLRGRLAELERQRIIADRAEGQKEAYRKAIPEYEREVLRLRAQWEETPEPDAARLKTALARATEEAKQAEEQASVAERNLFAVKAHAERVEEDYRTEMARGAELKEEVKRCEEELATLAFNNALMKKIRVLRPLVADRLWNTLLAAVGALFSRIREEDSVIVKDAGGFRCNGQVVESLSGSTLDALGAAIRVALCKTFLPHVDFIVLDEPAAACDPQRTARLLAFLASAGFGQILLVTHEEMSETFADTLIQLEEAP
jgi:DNA repair exonuclease SbcCD ATPase subunit